MRALLLILLVSLSVMPAHALDVLACEPEWAALATALGGEHVKVESATTPFQDVHYIQARPSLIAAARRADLLVCTGAGLEVGWLPLLLRQSGNPAIQPGRPGSLEAASQVTMLEVPDSVDRAQGDVHPYGNPHIQLEPRNIGRVAAELSRRLAALDPANAADYEARYRDFAQRWDAAVARWSERGRALAGTRVVTHHKSWVYLFDWLGMVEVGTLEPKPGLEPSTSHLAELLDRIRGQDVKLIIRSAYQGSRASEWLSGRTGIPAVVLPQTVGATAGADDLFSWFDTLLDQLEQTR